MADEDGSLDLMVLEGKGTSVAPYTASWYGIQTISQGFPKLFFDVGTILITNSSTIWWHSRFIHPCVSVGAF